MMASVLSLLDLDQAREFYARGWWRAETMYMQLRYWAERRPDAYAFRDTQSRLTYREALRWVDAVAWDLHEAGLRAGDRVSLWLPSRVESALVFLACSRMGYVCSPSLHRDYTCTDIHALLERTRSAAFFGQAGYGADAGVENIFSRLDDLSSLKKIYSLPPLASGGCPVDPHERFGGLALTASIDLPFSTSPDRVVYLAFTSGTTGTPKGVMHSDNTLLSNGRAIARDFAFNEETIVYTLSPMSHNMGTVALVTTLACGGELVVHAPGDNKHALDRIVETRATYLIGVPTHAIDLLAEARRRGLTRLGDVAFFQLAGSPIPAETVSALLSLGVTPQNCFGMTENCSFQYTRPDDPPETIINSCGRPCEGFELALWDPENSDRQVAAGEVGELGGRGCCLMLGYFDDQNNTERSFNTQGWFMTGDLGQLDSGGNLRIVGRKKDLIIRGGHNIHPAKIENLAMHHEAISKAAAFPVADSRLGEKVCLAVLTTEDVKLDGDQVLAHLHRVGLSKYDMPEYYLQLQSFPLTASGKVLKRKMAEDVASGALTPEPIRFRGG